MMLQIEQHIIEIAWFGQCFNMFHYLLQQQLQLPSSDYFAAYCTLTLLYVDKGYFEVNQFIYKLLTT